MNFDNLRQKKNHQKRLPPEEYCEPTFLFLARWRLKSKLWRQKCFDTNELAQSLIFTIEKEAGKPGPYFDVTSFRAEFADVPSFAGRHGASAGRFLVKWRFGLKVGMKIMPTEEDAREFHRLTWLNGRNKRGFWINRKIHCRVS